jgi:hypothetical protein
MHPEKVEGHGAACIAISTGLGRLPAILTERRAFSDARYMLSI